MAASLHNQICTSTPKNELMNTSTEYKGVVVIIPTRNRADLAINAILSVLNQPNCEDVQVLVSDNSTETENIELLAKFCKQNRDSRLSYIKTPEPMSMARHWDWILDQALELYDLNHFLYLTDRMIFKKGNLETLRHLSKHYSANIISYNHDKINDYKQPIFLEEHIWTGKIFRINSEHLLNLSSQSILHPCLPRMLNNITPRSVFETMKARYGNVFNSIAPDFCFCYRSLEMTDHILYYDKSILIQYGIGRSNGHSISRGKASRDSADFIENLPQGFSLNHFAPIPEIKTVCNAILHEYVFVKEETKSLKFPEVDKNKYLDALAYEVIQFEDEELKTEMIEILKIHGWQEKTMQKKSFIKTVSDKILKFFNIKKIFNKILTLITKNNIKIKFNTVQEAIEYCNTSPRKKNLDPKYLMSLTKFFGSLIDLPEEKKRLDVKYRQN
jgi:hypothetical protein